MDRQFEPLRDIEGAHRLTDADGPWPSFHDAEVYTVNIWSGDVRPDDDVWVGPRIDTALGILGPRGEMLFAIVRLRFKDCEGIAMTGTGLGCPSIDDLTFRFEPRGYLRDGVTPLSPYIHVTFSAGSDRAALLAFRCFTVEALARDVPGGPPYR